MATTFRAEEATLNATQQTVVRGVKGGRFAKALIFRVSVSLGLLWCASMAGREAIAWWHFNRGTPPEIARAIEWAPGHAEYYVGEARALEGSLEPTDVNRVIRLYEMATRLRPERASYWAELAGSYEWGGHEEEARRAYQRAAELAPNSPEINWRLGNFDIRSGRIAPALGAFRKTVIGDPELRRAAFDLAWRAGADPEQILSEMVPGDSGIQIAYLDYLVETHRLDAASEVWQRLIHGGARLEPRAAFPYIDALIGAQRGEEARSVWAVLVVRGPRAAARSADSSLITNGSFEGELQNGGLDWRILPTEGAVVSVDSETHFDGARSLRIHFDGRQNLAYSHLLQFVPVEAGTHYRLTAYLRAQKITSDSGPRVEIYDAGDASRRSLATESVIGTSGWAPVELEFTTRAETHVLVVRLARPPSRLLDGRIAGTVWLDRVSLSPTPPNRETRSRIPQGRRN